MKKAIILLGCPESPSQTPLALYASHKLTGMGYQVTVASTPSAKKLLEVSDPEEHYVKNKTDIESCLDGLNLPFLNHRLPALGGVCAEECAALLTAFFQARR